MLSPANGLRQSVHRWQQGCEPHVPAAASLPHKHYSPGVRFEVFTAVTMKNCVFWDVTPCGSCKQGYKNR
jgi:hypothetical protein